MKWGLAELARGDDDSVFGTQARWGGRHVAPGGSVKCEMRWMIGWNGPTKTHGGATKGRAGQSREANEHGNAS